MSILKISRLGHPILLEKTNPVKNIQDNEIKKIIYDMSETMIDAKGIGLAAPQVYINKQIMIFRTFNEDDDENNNPNGAIKNIAGIFNKNKNILGMMPHPERMIDPFLSGEDGSLFFENLIGSM